MAVVAAAVISGAVSLFSASKSRKAAKKAQQQEMVMREKEAQLGRDQLAFGMSQYNDWRDRFEPLYDDVRSMAYEDRRPDFARIQGDVGAAIDAGRGAERRQMARYGLNPADGAWGTGERQYGMSRGAAIAGAANRQRLHERDQRFSRIASLSGMLTPMLGMSQSNISGGYGTTGNAYGGMAGSYNNQAAQHRQDASDAYASAGYAIGSGLTQWQAGRNQLASTQRSLDGMGWNIPNYGTNFNYARGLSAGVPSPAINWRNVPTGG